MSSRQFPFSVASATLWQQTGTNHETTTRTGCSSKSSSWRQRYLTVRWSAGNATTVSVAYLLIVACLPSRFRCAISDTFARYFPLQFENRTSQGYTANTCKCLEKYYTCYNIRLNGYLCMCVCVCVMPSKVFMYVCAESLVVSSCSRRSCWAVKKVKLLSLRRSHTWVHSHCCGRSVAHTHTHINTSTYIYCFVLHTLALVMCGMSYCGAR